MYDCIVYDKFGSNQSILSRGQLIFNLSEIPECPSVEFLLIPVSFSVQVEHISSRKVKCENLSDLADEMHMLAHNLHFNYAFRIKMEIRSEVCSCDSNVSE